MDYATTNAKVLNEILEKTSTSSGMFVRKVYKNLLKQIISIFSNVRYVNKNNRSVKIKCFHANQERAVAKATVGDNITLPIITISETSTANDTDRQRYGPMLVHEKYWDKDKQRAIRLISLAPKPVNISYSINIWAKYKQDLDQIREYIFLMFNPDMEIQSEYNNANKAFIESESEVNQIEAPDKQDRILQKTIRIKVYTYIPSPRFLYTSTGKIEEFNNEIELVSSVDEVKSNKDESVRIPTT